MYKHPKSEPIAIIGSSCRFAGSATSPSNFWTLLSAPRDLSKEVPKSRFSTQAFYHPDGEYHGTTNSIKAYWLEQDHRVFDASFFNITPKEAEAIDPQQRLLLEVVYEAMESAGYTLPQCSGKDVAVFSGVMTADYDTLSQRDELSTSQYYATGNARSIISNRVSYFFNFRGPSMTIDTACSSSLVALHQAVLSLRSGESSMACVTGVNLMITPEQFIVESSLHMLSPSGKCRMWDVDADGYARGEGVAAVFLKPLSLALEKGDNIIGIVRETGVNSDGRTKGITMPNPNAQASLIRSTYAKTGLDPEEPADRCQYFEAHGTGTQAGDPREAEAIQSAFFGPIDAKDVPRKMLVGSVKTVIGHTEGAAGLAGVLKVLQAMKHGSVPPNLHFNLLNPSVEPFSKHLEIVTSLIPWPETLAGQPRRASVNSFGFGGTNSHAIIEAYTPDIHDDAVYPSCRSPKTWCRRRNSLRSTRDASVPRPFSLPLFMSATSQKALRAVIETWKLYLLQHPCVSLAELGWNLFSRRTALPYRITISAASKPAAVEQLDALLAKSASDGEIGVRSRAMEGKARVLGIFTGQGAQWPTMSRSLFLSNKSYRQTIQSLDQVLKLCPDPPTWSLEAEILADEDVSRINEAAISQPLCTALQLGLVDLLRSLHVEFHTVVGHSSGEIAAAYAAGRLTARDAILISYYRGHFAHLAGGANGEKGGMLAAGLTEREALEFCRDPMFDDRICVAASNAPSSVTLSGDLEMIQLAKDKLVQQQKFARLLNVDTAYHSTHMTRPAMEYITALQVCGISPLSNGNGVNWVSSVQGFSHTGEEDIGAGYWKDNMVHRVQFHDAIEVALLEYGPFDCALEIGPHPTLKGPVTQTAKLSLGSSLLYSGILERSKDDSLAFSEFLGFMWCQMGPVAVALRDYIELSANPSLLNCHLEDMPSYPWDHSQTHYRESRISRQYHFKDATPHELLGVRTRDDNDFELRWRNILRPEKIPWLEHHRFQGQALLPASAYCIMALDAACVLLGSRSAPVVEIRDLDIMSGLSIEEDSSGTEILFSLAVSPQPKANVIKASFSLTSCPADASAPMKKNMSGNLRIMLGEVSGNALPPREEYLSETLSANPEAFYKMMDSTGLVYSGPFRALQTIERRYCYSSTSLRRRHPDDTTSLKLSPATLDTCLQSAFLSYASPGDRSLWTSFLPTRIERIKFNNAIYSQDLHVGDASVLAVDTHLISVSPATLDSKAIFIADIGIFSDQGEMEVQIEGLTVEAFANTRPDEDYELYLHTVMDVDPSDEIVQTVINIGGPYDPMLIESCERVAAFYARDRTTRTRHLGLFDGGEHPSSNQGNWNLDWPMGSSATIDDFIADSPYRTSLKFFQNLGQLLPDLLPAAMPLVVEETHMNVLFNQHIERIVRQVSHRYPRMNVFSIADPEINLTRYILSGLGASFLSYTIGLVPGDCAHEIPHLATRFEERVHNTNIDLEQDIKPQLAAGTASDLVILSTSILETGTASDTLRNIRASMRDGGYLVLVHVPQSPLKERLRRVAGANSSKQVLSSPPEWPDLLDVCGFRSIAKHADQSYALGFSVSIRQVDAPCLQIPTDPMAMPASRITDSLVIIGGATDSTERIRHGLYAYLSAFCGSVTTSVSFDALDSPTLARCTAAIVLADIDDSVVSRMTERRLDQLRGLFKPSTKVLWLTQDARHGNPDHAATFGFTRTIAAEVPGMKLQVLDLEKLNGSETLIAETFIRLVVVEPEYENTLWTSEPEIHIENGRRLVPRVMPLHEFNDRVNRLRRPVSRPINTINSMVEIVTHRSSEGSLRHETRASEIRHTRDLLPTHVFLQVNFSSLELVKMIPGSSAYICAGRDVTTGEAIVALSYTNASYIEVPVSHMQRLTEDITLDLHLVRRLVRYLAASAYINYANGRKVILVEPDQLFLQCFDDVASEEEKRPAVWSATSMNTDKVASSVFALHPHLSNRHLQSIFPVDGAVIYDFLPDNSELSGRIVDLLPGNCEYQSHYSFFGPQPSITNGDLSSMELTFRNAVTMATQKTPETSETVGTPDALSVNQVVSKSWVRSSLDIIDWRVSRNTTEMVTPIVELHLFDPRKTYILIGLTRDLGQSLCRLFIGHGARHLVLASRKPNLSSKWKTELSRTHGVTIHFEKLDVTSPADVWAFKSRLSKTMPPVAGVVNGAMVLEDRVFAQMTLENWNRVLLPKTVGSKNLDMVFGDSDLEFFIMTSSFAAIGGHPGQSNYATANMYMNGLAANRRKRGLAGSVLNIGVIYGLGLLQREKEELYVGLEREGYPPVSERDIHHMFLEAIVAGRPGQPSHPFDITTGLSRFRWGSSNPLHWHLDPRFSHFSLNHSEYDPGVELGTQRRLIDNLKSFNDVEEMATAIVVAFAERLESLLQLPKGSVNQYHSISELGIDSLIAVDIRNWIWKALGRDVAVLKILGARSVHRLCLDIAEHLFVETNQSESPSSVHTPSTSPTPSDAGGASSTIRDTEDSARTADELRKLR
ncbi:hypothetical protein BJ170DRAFT_661182 [Xylariales sp. AK1849]|nr:hypothetical protein BJ170DRAFT_661182 [Xylariales sp. AK1849]